MLSSLNFKVSSENPLLASMYKIKFSGDVRFQYFLINFSLLYSRSMVLFVYLSVSTQYSSLSQRTSLIIESYEFKKRFTSCSNSIQCESPSNFEKYAFLIM